MVAWTLQRIAALRQRGAALREIVAEPDLATVETAERERQSILEAEQAQAIAYAAGLYQSQQDSYHPTAEDHGPYLTVDPELDL